MPVISAGLVLYRTQGGAIEVLLGRLGGPLWAKRQHWTLPKGIVEDGEDPLDTAYREFEEETGQAAPNGDPLPLGEIRQRGGKRVVAWAIDGDFDLAAFEPGTFTMEWPPRSGRFGEFPELAEVGWFRIDEAKDAINTAQVPLLDRLQGNLAGPPPAGR